MPLIHWTLSDGRRISDNVAEGTHLMDAAQFAGVPGIAGECGGCMSCATCHVVVDATWAEKVGPPGADECLLLDAAPTAPQPNSRLSCQIMATSALDGLVLHVPQS
ncbi:MAG: (2Fe-2S)-binding protein [Betaproteobacteria bacterium]|jgi:ferredoxin, 2Fe-2S|nr:(2Fe-2S)-binding protein [Betaproteobacteria bacterium]